MKERVELRLAFLTGQPFLIFFSGVVSLLNSRINEACENGSCKALEINFNFMDISYNASNGKEFQIICF